MLRDSIQVLAAAGLPADSIIEMMVAEYGEKYRAEPKSSGAGLWAWLLPPVSLVGGLLAVAGVLSRRRRDEEEPLRRSTPTVEDEARLKEALRVLDEEEEPAF